MDFEKDYYGVLGVLPNTEVALIKAAYKALVQHHHPDKCKGSKQEAENKMKELNEAFSILSNAQKRKQYDNYLKAQREKNRHGSASAAYDENVTKPTWTGANEQEHEIKEKKFTAFSFFAAFSIILFVGTIIFSVRFYQNTNKSNIDRPKKIINSVIETSKNERENITIINKSDKAKLPVHRSIHKEKEKLTPDKKFVKNKVPHFSNRKSPEYLNYLLSRTEFNLPVSLDDDILWKKVTAREAAIVYHYYFTHHQSSHYSAEKVFKRKSEINKKQTCESLIFQGFLEQGVRHIYRYYGNDNEYITETSVSLEDCKALLIPELKSTFKTTAEPSGVKKFQPKKQTLKRKKKIPKMESIKTPCYFKSVMTDEDYLNCGLTPP